MNSATDFASAIDFNSAVERAKLRALYHFAYGLSHEINNPLANIATRAQTLLVDEKDPERRRKLATIVQQSFRAHEMIADLMLFAHPPKMQAREVDLMQLVDTVVGELLDQAREQGTTLRRTGDSGPLLAMVDPTQIAVATKAIVQNSLEALQEGGSVEVNVSVSTGDAETQDSSTECSVHSTKYSEPQTATTQSQSRTILHPAASSPVPKPLSPAFSSPRTPHFLLTVTDTGPGIPAEIRPHIFDPFFSGREAGRGLGLGLSKAWRIVELHGGTIQVESEPGSRTTFAVILPATSRPLASEL